MLAVQAHDFSVYIGWDPREAKAYDVCEFSMRRRSAASFPIRAIKLPDLQRQGWYRRATSHQDGRLWDVVSDAPMSQDKAQWALFCDCDFLWLNDVETLIAQADDSKALMCVQHHHEPPEGVKMDGQMQLRYARKNWSSLMLFNLRHPAHARLDLDTLNTRPGRDLHRFCWLEDDQIGALDPGWNWLEGWSPQGETPPHVVHYTRGGPWMPDWTEVAHADLWLGECAAMDAEAKAKAKATALRQASQGAKAGL